MKLLHTAAALFLSAALLAGCTAAPAESEAPAAISAEIAAVEPSAEGETPVEDAVPTEEAVEATEDTPAEAEAPKLQQVKVLVHPTGGGNLYFTVDYDEEGRPSAMYCRFGEDTVPATAAEDDTMYVDYSGGAPDVYYLPEYVNAFPDAPYSPSICDVQTYDDGALKLVYGAFGAALEFEFNENGLPAYVLNAQDDISHKLLYTQDADGRYAFAGGEEVYGHFFDGVDTPYAQVAPDVFAGMSASYEGWVTYQ